MGLSFFISIFLIDYLFYNNSPRLRKDFSSNLSRFPKLLASYKEKLFYMTASFVNRKVYTYLPRPWIYPFPSPMPTIRAQPTHTPIPTVIFSPTPYTPFPTNIYPTAILTNSLFPSPTLIKPLPTATLKPTPIPTEIIPSITPLPPIDSLTLIEEATINIINQRRQQMGLVPLTVNFQLVAAARRHSKDISDHNSCGHYGTDGSDPWQRARETGFSGTVYGETVGCGYTTALAVVNGWWGSPPHKAALTNTKIRLIGLGWSTNSPWRTTAVVGY